MKSETMQYSHFIDHGAYPELFDDGEHNSTAKRVQKCKIDSWEREFEQLPMLSQLFDRYLIVASNHVHYNTNIVARYKFTGNNLLENIGPVREQYIHTDYEVMYDMTHVPAIVTLETATNETKEEKEKRMLDESMDNQINIGMINAENEQKEEIKFEEV